LGSIRRIFQHDGSLECRVRRAGEPPVLEDAASGNWTHVSDRISADCRSRPDAGWPEFWRLARGESGIGQRFRRNLALLAVVHRRYFHRTRGGTDLFSGSHVKQRFTRTLPGAVIAVGCWILLSWALGFYFQHFANLNKTYGTLAAAIALMVWLYWTAFAVLLGGEINADLLHAAGKHIPVKEAEAP